jgi:hypothetical protein
MVRLCDSFQPHFFRALRQAQGAKKMARPLPSLSRPLAEEGSQTTKLATLFNTIKNKLNAANKNVEKSFFN